MRNICHLKNYLYYCFFLVANANLTSHDIATRLVLFAPPNTHIVYLVSTYSNYYIFFFALNGIRCLVPICSVADPIRQMPPPASFFVEHFSQDPQRYETPELGDQTSTSCFLWSSGDRGIINPEYDICQRQALSVGDLRFKVVHMPAILRYLSKLMGLAVLDIV